MLAFSASTSSGDGKGQKRYGSPQQVWKKSLPGPLDEVNAELLRTGHANGELVCEKLRGTQIIVPAADTTSPCVHSSAWREIEGAGSGKHPGVIGEGRDQWMRAI